MVIDLIKVGLSAQQNDLEACCLAFMLGIAYLYPSVSSVLPSTYPQQDSFICAINLPRVANKPQKSPVSLIKTHWDVRQRVNTVKIPIFIH